MANNIAYLRAKHGLTQKELAQKIDMHLISLGYAENHTCCAKLAKKVADALDENPFVVLGSDVLKMLPTSDEDKEILIKMIRGL